mgnify:FL=1
MRRLNRFVSIFAMPLLLNCLAGCGGDGENYFTPWINIDKSYETMIGGGGCFYVHLEATYDWEQRIQYENSDNTDWISLNHTFGLGGSSYNIKVNVEPNFGERRTATVVFYLKGYGEQCELRIVQSGGNGGSTEISAPSNLRASANGNTISLSWNSVSEASRYYVYYSTSSNGSWTCLGYTDGTACTTTAETAGTYYFVVTAADSYGNESSYSNTASCNVTSGGGGSGGGTSKPSTPTGVKAVLNGDNIIVSWNASNGAEYYQVYYDRPAPYNGATFENCYKTSMTFYPKTIYGVWTFWVVAVSSDYQLSDASSKVTLNYTSGGGGGGGGQSQLNAPQNIEAYSGYSFVQISFAPVPGAYDYYLYRSTSPNSGYSKITASGGSSGNRYVLTDQNPKNGTTYYKVKAIALPSTGIKDSEYSSYVKVVR